MLDTAHVTATRWRVALAALVAALPRGGLLPDVNWRRRHAALTAILVAHAPVVMIYALMRGYPLEHAVLEATLVLVLAAASWPARLGRNIRSMTVAGGLIACSVVVVHLSNGQIEAHFHFFVMVSLLTLYQDWRPFLVAISLVVIEHGVTGVVAPHAVYNHEAAYASPWQWAFVHGGFVLAASAANITSWSFAETDHRRHLEQARRLHDEREALLRHESHHDTLTGLPNRRMAIDHLEAAARRSRATGTLLGLLFIDLDGFKQVNDTYGHLVGDMVLVQTADRLRTAVRGSDVAARLGGDEFLLIYEGLADDAALDTAVTRVESALRGPMRIDDETTVTIGASIGRVTADADGAWQDLIERADLDMYRVKHRRRRDLRQSSTPEVARPRTSRD